MKLFWMLFGAFLISTSVYSLTYDSGSFGISPTGTLTVGTLTATTMTTGTLTATTMTTNNIQYESATVAISTANTTATSRGNTFPAYLSGSNNAIEGSLLVAAPTVAGQGVSVAVSSSAAAQTAWIGIAAAAASTGSVVNVYTSGWVLALTTGTVNPGDILVSTTAAVGYLGVQNAPTTGTDVGVALAPGILAGGRTKISLR